MQPSTGGGILNPQGVKTPLKPLNLRRKLATFKMSDDDDHVCISGTV